MKRTVQFLVVFGFLVSNLVSQGGSSGSVIRQSAPKAARIISATLDRLRPVQAGDFRGYFKAIRPPRLSDAMRSQVLASLPREGEIMPAAGEVAKVSTLAPILAYHDRESVMELKVIQAFQAAVAIHARCVLLVSEQALRLLTAAELQALVAHELGHEYIWNEYEKAKSGEDHEQVQQLELWCDAVAVLTLHDIGADTRALASAIAKMNRFNKRFGTPANAGDYPTDSVRSEFHAMLSQLCVNADNRGDRSVKRVRIMVPELRNSILRPSDSKAPAGIPGPRLVVLYTLALTTRRGR
ncbi:MAG: hypothetical protein EHM61_22810 [Acidobacteria bacterium]|nr:MAG: hypothetical protein EHM61_22810 [Acidobacteriota bacterium]